MGERPFCPMHEYEWPSCDESCQQARVEYKAQNHGLASLWFDRKKGKHPNRPGLVVGQPVELISTREHALDRLRRAIGDVAEFEPEIAKVVKEAFRRAVVEHNAELRRNQQSRPKVTPPHKLCKNCMTRYVLPKRSLCGQCRNVKNKIRKYGSQRAA